MPEVLTTCVAPVDIIAECDIPQAYQKNGRFLLFFNMGPGIWTDPGHLGKIVFGPKPVGTVFDTVQFMLANQSPIPLDINYKFANSELFAYDIPADEGVISLAAAPLPASVYYGSIRVHYTNFDEDIQDFIVGVLGGQQIIVSLRNSTSLT
jgi:hypothetical protein